MTTLDVSVSASGDDGFSFSPGGGFTSNLYLQFGPQGFEFGRPFARFLNVTVPQGATITAAYIRFTANANEAADAGYIVYGNDTDSAVAPTSTAEVEALALTTASAAWTLSGWISGSEYDTPSLVTVVQEIIDRAGWASGNAMQFVLIYDSGIGMQRAKGYDTLPAAAPLLHIEYTTPSVPVLRQTGLAGGLQ